MLLTLQSCWVLIGRCNKGQRRRNMRFENASYFASISIHELENYVLSLSEDAEKGPESVIAAA